ncbi:putative rhizobiocin/RTX toxin and hemolysin-type calcium-binding protein [Cyanobium sp. Copco_Reservoir_LC18]|nr:putative rhizobiocin/RTX toxin and hemolysin-type calcium-binding protein [Cyanobium sp. Copco_Reservoir_LC18]
MLEDGAPNLIFTFSRTGTNTAPLTVNYTVSGTADATDYTGIDPAGTTKTVTFAAGSSTAVVTVDPTADTTVEANETVALTLASGNGYRIGTATAVTGTITNDDSSATANQTLNGTTNADLLIGGSGNDSLSGLASNDTLIGNGGNDTLNGGTEADIMSGGLGNDTYTIDNIGDQVIEAAGQGTDLVQSSITYTLGADLENLTLTGNNTAINGTGNNLDNVLTGNSGNNSLSGLGGNDTLNGGTGADTMSGGLGNDTYTVDNSGDQVLELSGEGTDLVQSSVTYTLGNNVENLTLTGTTAINGTGNNLDNVLTGNSGANSLTGLDGNDTLNGGTGADTMSGGLGNDTYGVDNAGDQVLELTGEGTDLVQTSITYTLGNNVENLTLTGTTAINGTGNELDNVLIGNSGVNTLSGLGGNDLLTGLAGNDSLSGGGGNDTLDGGAGRDTLTGGLGSDVFRFSSLSNSLLLSGTTSARDRITDLDISADSIDGPNVATATYRGVATSLTETAIASLLTSTTFAANGAATFASGSSFFLALNDSNAGFQASTDSVIDITGYTGGNLVIQTLQII